MPPIICAGATSVTRRRDVRQYALLAVVFAAGAAVCIGLGRWQLDRAGQVRSAAAAFRAAGEAEPLRDLAAAAADPDAYRFRTVDLAGRYESEPQVLLDNITKDGAVGYYVLTPFRPAGAERLVLVNRGWIEADPDRRVVPGLDVDGQPRRVTGRIDRLPSAALSWGASAETVRAGLYRASYPTAAELERLLDVELAPFQLELDAAAADGFERSWTPGTRRADRNTAYAGQWFIMAVAAAALAVWAALRAGRAAHGTSDPS